MRSEIYELEIKLEFLTDIDVLLMLGKGIIGGLYHSIKICKS